MPEPWHKVGKNFNRGIWVFFDHGRSFGYTAELVGQVAQLVEQLTANARAHVSIRRLARPFRYGFLLFWRPTKRRVMGCRQIGFRILAITVAQTLVSVTALRDQSVRSWSWLLVSQRQSLGRCLLPDGSGRM